MIVHFGPYFDAMQPDAPVTAVGEATLGPARLIGVLEQQLGLPAVPARPGEALIAYQSCLEDCDTPERFYHASLKVDPIGVARTLLGWRARWHEAGWRGTFAGTLSRRLADLADVERIAAERVPPNPGQRLQRIKAALESGLATQIERIVLHEDEHALPAAWRDVLAHFHCERAPGVEPQANAPAGTDLHTLQRLLIDLEHDDAGGTHGSETGAGEGRAEPVQLAGDSSVVVLRGVSRDLSAQVVGEILREADTPDDTVLIAERDGIIVDNALERVGLARAGFQHHSPFRAVAQVLKLALALIWKPVSARLLLQFLLHPVGPLPRRVRAPLAEAVADQPGIGGQAWQDALAVIAGRERERDGGEKGAERILADVRYWLECERHSPDDGAPTAALIERAQRCATWLTQRLHAAGGSDADLYGAALAQSEALIDALRRLGERGTERVGRLVLERLVDEVSGHAPDPATFAEAGHVRATTTPGAVTRPVEQVVWWDLAPRAERLELPWSESELAELAAEGLALPAAEAVIRARARGWARPVLNARSRLILVVHDGDEGRHPLWSRLTSLARGFNETRIEDALLGGAAAIEPLGVRLEPLAERPLPLRRRWWQLPPGTPVPPREAESYSSLQKLAYHPHQWVLRYAARLSPGRASNLADGPLLHGKLAHRLFEEYFGRFAGGALPDWSAYDENETRAWAASALPRIVEREGAVLDEPGRRVIREQVLVTLERSLLALLGHLRQADIVRVEAEARHDVPFGDDAAMRLRGAIDLLLTDRAGREIVLDVKWGRPDARGREIAENRALQLATYAYMRSTAGHAGHWPEQAYFIVTTGDVVASDTRIFPDAVPYPPDEPETAEHVWRRVLRTYAWRHAQLERGAIEVNALGTEPDARSSAPEDALATPAEPDKYDDFLMLTGREPGE